MNNLHKLLYLYYMQLDAWDLGHRIKHAALVLTYLDPTFKLLDERDQFLSKYRIGAGNNTLCTS
jgi:hypothetical protein